MSTPQAIWTKHVEEMLRKPRVVGNVTFEVTPVAKVMGFSSYAMPCWDKRNNLLALVQFPFRVKSERGSFIETVRVRMADWENDDLVGYLFQDLWTRICDGVRCRRHDSGPDYELR